MITDKVFPCTGLCKFTLGLLITFCLGGCTLAAPMSDEVTSKISLNLLSKYETTQSEINDIKYIDTLGQLLVITEIGGLYLDVNTGEKVSQFSGKGDINKIKLDASGKLLMISSRDQVRIVNVKDQTTVWEKNDEGASGDQLSAFAPDGGSLYAFSTIWRLDNSSRGKNSSKGNAPIENIHYPAAAMSSEISPDNRFLLNTGLYGTFDLIDMKTGAYIHQWDTDRNVAGGSFSMDSKYVYIVSGAKSMLAMSKKMNDVDVFNLTDYAKIKELSHKGNITTFTLSRPSGDLFVGTDAGEISHWSAKSFKNQGYWKDSGWIHASISDDSGRVWFGCENGKLKFYNPYDNTLSSVMNLGAPIAKLAVSKKGDIVATVKQDGQKREITVFQVTGL